LTGKVVDAGAGTVVVAGQSVRAAGPVATSNGGTVAIGLRPEALSFAGGEASANRLRGTVDEVAFLGAVIRVRVRVGEAMLSVDTFNQRNGPVPAKGAACTVSFAPADVLALAT
jgi:putative spermidine/putrescine transport system ATP-binding protein